MHDDRPGEPLRELLRRFRHEHDALAPADDRRHFCGLYLRSTLAMQEELDRGGFADPDWVRRLTVAFATRYLDALAGSRAGRPVPLPWRLALRDRPGTAPVRHQLVGLNAHLNFDLPQVLLDVLGDADLHDPAVRALRHEDFRHVDDVMLRRIPEESRRLRQLGGPPARALLDRALHPLNLAATRRWLVTARRLVWCNAEELLAARAAGGTALPQRLADLERVCAAKVDDLLRPGPVLLRLGIGGFGVALPQRPAAAPRHEHAGDGRGTA